MEKPKIVSLKEPEDVGAPGKQVDVPDLPSEKPELKPQEQQLPELPQAEKSEEPEIIQLPEEEGGKEAPAAEQEPKRENIREARPAEPQQLPWNSQEIEKTKSYAGGEEAKELQNEQPSQPQDVLEPEELPLSERPQKLEKPEMKEIRLQVQPEQPAPAEQPKRIVFRPPVEQKEDELASELMSPKVVAVQERPELVKAYQEQAARDILPMGVEPSPMELHGEREKARALAKELHEKEQAQGFMGKIKRFFRLD